jgi:hypothetical protein
MMLDMPETYEVRLSGISSIIRYYPRIGVAKAEVGKFWDISKYI